MASSTRLSKQLTLFDVFVISTGAMFSSGFFLLPGVAASKAGPAVILAYVLSGLIMVPAACSLAELATAMPRAGGPYYFLDRSLGPLVGTVGGLGTWLALVLKSAFALIGMGAYLALFVEVPVKPLAIACTVALASLNILGARETTGLQRGLVVTVITILSYFIAEGLLSTVGGAGAGSMRPFFAFGIDGLLATVGLVAVSFAGLLKVASLSEEVRHPDRDIPLGMLLSLTVATTIYALGAYVMVVALEPEMLHADLTPVASAAERVLTRGGPGIAVTLVVLAALAGFASAGNAGVLSASRYPLAMARDGLLPGRLARLGRFGTPTGGIVVTAGAMIAFIAALDVRAVAELASAVLLLVLMLVNLAVIVMRESHIESYDPGFRAPLYPWLPLAGLVAPLLLVAEMGWLPVLFTMAVVGVGVAWYTYYGQARLRREGAIYHVFERLGRRRSPGLDRELRDIMKEKGLRAEDPFDEVVARAIVVGFSERVPLTRIIREAAARLHSRLPVDGEQLVAAFLRGAVAGGTPVSHGAALLHTRLPDFEGSELLLVRCTAGVDVDVADETLARQAAEAPIGAVFFLVSGELDPGRHLRILAQLAGRVEDPTFMPEWLANSDEQELKETLLRDDRFLRLRVGAGSGTAALVGRALRDLQMPEGSLVAIIQRDGQPIVPRGRTVLREGDRLTIIGEPEGLREVERRYGE